MPVVQFHLVVERHEDAAMAALLIEASDFYVRTLYPDLVPPPIDRVRAFIVPIAARHMATAGRLVSEGGGLAPYFECLVLTGRPIAQLHALMAGFTDLIVRHLRCDRSMVRGIVTQVSPECWSIGGIPASAARAAEAAMRAAE